MSGIRAMKKKPPLFPMSCNRRQVTARAGIKVPKMKSVYKTPNESILTPKSTESRIVAEIVARERNNWANQNSLLLARPLKVA